MTARHLAWTTGRMNLPSAETVKTVRGSRLGGQVRSSVSKMLSLVCLFDLGGGEESAIAYSFI